MAGNTEPVSEALKENFMIYGVERRRQVQETEASNMLAGNGPNKVIVKGE